MKETLDSNRNSAADRSSSSAHHSMSSHSPPPGSTATVSSADTRTQSRTASPTAARPAASLHLTLPHSTSPTRFSSSSRRIVNAKLLLRLTPTRSTHIERRLARVDQHLLQLHLSVFVALCRQHTPQHPLILLRASASYALTSVLTSSSLPSTSTVCCDANAM